MTTREPQHQDPADPARPTKPPRTDAKCWPFPCRDYHETYAHQSGEEPCSCPCHIFGANPGERDETTVSKPASPAEADR